MRQSGWRLLFAGLAMTGALAMTGCGEEPYELQENEQAIISNYAAHIIAKYNIKQTEGYQYVYVPEEETLPADEDAQSKEQTDENTAEADAQTDASGDKQDAESSATLAEALGLKKIQAVYTGTELTKQYGSVTASEGRQLMVVHVTLQNRTKKARACDILKDLPGFRATVNGSVHATAELAILPENLATWEEKIPANSGVDTVMIFQVDPEQVSAVEQLEIEVTVGEKSTQVIFL